MNSPSLNVSLVVKSWIELSDDLQSGYQGEWICDESWFRIIKAKYQNLSLAFAFTRGITLTVFPIWLGDSLNLMHMAFITRCLCQFVGMKGRGDPLIISFITNLLSVQKISTVIHHVHITT